MLAFRSLDPFRALREPDRRRRDEERLSRSEQRTGNKPKRLLDRKSPIQVRCLCPPGKTQHLLPKSVFDRPGSDRWNLASTTFPDAGPMVRIRFPPAESHVRTSLSREFAFLRR